MSVKRQNNQLELAYPASPPSEAKRLEGGTEASSAERSPESSAKSDSLMEAVCESENMAQAWRKVRSNKGASGVDGMTVAQAQTYLGTHWPAIKQQLLSGTYKPQPVRRVEIPKPDGGVRQLGIPTVVDRLVQQAILQVLTPIWEPAFSEHSYGFRPGRSAHQAVVQAQRYIEQGHGIVVDLDLEKFFDKVNHDMLMARVARRVSDKRVLKIIRAFLNAGVMENGLVSQAGQGTPQGGPLSPLLSNIMLDDLDRELEKRGHCFVRYADDCNIYVRTQRAGERVMQGITQFITRRLQLKVNQSKSAVDQVTRRDFLGFSFTMKDKPRRKVAARALQKCKRKIRELTRRNRGIDARQMVSELATYLRGWIGYFGISQTPTPLHDLEGWTRRRLRAVAWHQWKYGRKRVNEMVKRGVSLRNAAAAASSCRHPWAASHHASVHTALPNQLWTRLGLPSLTAATTA